MLNVLKKKCIKQTNWHEAPLHRHWHTSTYVHGLPLPFKTTLSQGNFQFPNTCKHAVLPQLLWSSNRPELCPGGGQCVERWLGGVCFPVLWECWKVIEHTSWPFCISYFRAHAGKVCHAFSIIKDHLIWNWNKINSLSSSRTRGLIRTKVTWEKTKLKVLLQLQIYYFTFTEQLKIPVRD